VKRGDEVLIQAFTCLALPEAIMSLGAMPKYVDVAPESPNMNPEDLRRKIGDSTRALVVQHSFGLPADILSLAAIAREAGIPLVEDCAHSIASTVAGRRVGSFGVAAFFSYEASKPIFAGLGGGAVINDAALAETVNADYAAYSEPSLAGQAQLAAMFIAHRLAYRPSTYWKVRSLFRAVSRMGLIRGNYNKVADEHGPAADFSKRMGRLQVRILERELRGLEANTAHRQRVANAYRAGIRRPGAAHLTIPSDVNAVFGRYPLVAEEKASLIEGAKRAKVELADFYATAVHPLQGEALRRVGYEPGSCENAEWIARRVVSLPTGPQVDQGQIDRAISYLNG
jgi:dTDP-4-amino-4,6-dideoxygalactose transaminase